MILKKKIVPGKSGDNREVRLRGRHLQKIRVNHLWSHPLCVECLRQDRITPAKEIDHIVALVNGGLDVESNRQGLCYECHAEKTRRDLGQKERPAIGLDGWPKNPT